MGLSAEQFDFLHNLQILEAVGVAQEVFHRVKHKAMGDGIMQLDLNKAYDWVSWGFLRLILIHISLPFRMIKWVMGCVTSVSYAVLVNGKPTNLSKAERVL